MKKVISLLLIICLSSSTVYAADNNVLDLVNEYDLQVIYEDQIELGVEPLIINSLEEFEQVLKNNEKTSIVPVNVKQIESTEVGISPMGLWPPVETENVKYLYNKFPMAVLVSEVDYTYQYNDTESEYWVTSIDNSSIYFESSVSCTWDEEIYDVSISIDYRSIEVDVEGNIYQTIYYDGNYYQDLVSRIDTTYRIYAPN